MDAVSSRPPGTWRRAVTGAAQDLSPGAFAFVMATGIVSTALAERSASASSAALLWIAGAGYVLLWASYLWRTVLRWQPVRTDLAGPRGFAFLTLVAASDVLVGRLALDRHYGAAAALTAIGVAVWLVPRKSCSRRAQMPASWSWAAEARELEDASPWGPPAPRSCITHTSLSSWCRPGRQQNHPDARQSPAA